MVHWETDLCSDGGGAFVHEPCLPLHKTRISSQQSLPRLRNVARVAAAPSALNLYVKSQSTQKLLLPLLAFYLINDNLISPEYRSEELSVSALEFLDNECYKLGGLHQKSGTLLEGMILISCRCVGCKGLGKWDTNIDFISCFNSTQAIFPCGSGSWSTSWG